MYVSILEIELGKAQRLDVSSLFQLETERDGERGSSPQSGEQPRAERAARVSCGVQGARGVGGAADNIASRTSTRCD